MRLVELLPSDIVQEGDILEYHSSFGDYRQIKIYNPIYLGSQASILIKLFKGKILRPTIPDELII